MTESVIDGGAAAPAGSTGAPVSQATPAQNTAGTPTETKAESPPAVDTPREPKGVAKRIDELTRNWREAQRYNERLLAIIEAERIKAPPRESEKPAQPKGLKDFNYDENAYREYLFTEAASKAATVAEQKAQEALSKREAQTRREAYDAKAEAFAKTVEDFEEVIRGNWACSEPMAEVIEGSDEGPALAYYLAQNPDVALKLAKLTAAQAGRELARIEDRLVNERKAASQKPVSQAPPPPPKIEGSDPGNAERDPTKMTQKQFNKWREGFIGKRR